ncbi:MAG: hypothetical protein LH647_14695, partial [Leptolyngbyaceae cyanobacterium CAN_BIN12]|nr:hypothetical protein [Leptolyngbyaceae cyanobacterium CAN_BIN12]
SGNHKRIKLLYQFLTVISVISIDNAAQSLFLKSKLFRLVRSLLLKGDRLTTQFFTFLFLIQVAAVTVP